MTDMIQVPRAVLERLVDAKTKPYSKESMAWRDHPMECVYCHELETFSPTAVDGFDHAADCPVRIVQDVLTGTRSFCAHCGRDDTGDSCRCWNDE